MADKTLKELHDVRMLLMLLLYKLGATQTEIANALDVTQAAVSEMMASSNVKAAAVDVRGSEKA